MAPEERLRAASARVSEVCGLLARPTQFNLAMCAPLLDSARDLLATAQKPGSGNLNEAVVLAGRLARADALARHAAAFFGECVRLAGAGGCVYTAVGQERTAETQVHFLGEA